MKLTDADALRQKDPQKAVELYVALRDAIDPGDVDRVTWLAQHAEHEPALESLFRAAFHRDGLRLPAAQALANLKFDAWDLENAEKFFRIVVIEAPRSDRTWLRACINLAQVYRLMGRLFEALVLARLAGRDARRRDESYYYAVTRLHLTGILSDLEDVERFERALIEFTATLEESPPPGDVLQLLPHCYRARLLSLRGDVAGALEQLDVFDAAAEGVSDAEEVIVETAVFRADLLRHAGRLDEAQEVLDRAAASDLERADFRLLLKKVQLLIRLDADGPEAAHGLAHELLEELLASWRRAGSGTVLRFAAELGSVLLEEFGEVDDARHAFDLAARAALTRIVELDRCVRELPQLTAPTPEDVAILADYRRRFVDEQAEMLSTVAEYLQNRAVQAADLIVRDELIALCAWCQRVRTADGHWLPIANYIPGEDQFDLSHGICDVCAKGLRAEAAARG